MFQPAKLQVRDTPHILQAALNAKNVRQLPNKCAKTSLAPNLHGYAVAHQPAQQNQKRAWTQQKNWCRARPKVRLGKVSLVCHLAASDSVQKELNCKALHFRGRHLENLQNTKCSMHLITHLNLAIAWALLVRTAQERAHCSISLLVA